jgi:hypothetical protein
MTLNQHLLVAVGECFIDPIRSCIFIHSLDIEFVISCHIVTRGRDMVGEYTYCIPVQLHIVYAVHLSSAFGAAISSTQHALPSSSSLTSYPASSIPPTNPRQAQLIPSS